MCGQVDVTAAHSHKWYTANQEIYVLNMSCEIFLSINFIVQIIIKIFDIVRSTVTIMKTYE